jgi:hypothetical protein
MSLKGFIIRWNNDHPLDKKFRDKYKIAFNSIEHRNSNQLDILFEYLEDQLFVEYDSAIEQRINKQKQYEAGQWLEEVKMSEQEAQDLFDKIDIFAIKKDDV